MKTEWKLIVKFVVSMWGKKYMPWSHFLKWKAYEELLKAPYVRESTEEELSVEKEFKKKQTAARIAKGVIESKVVPAVEEKIEEVVTEPVVGPAVEEVTTFTEEELRVLPEADLRALYIAEQGKLSKQVPPNIGLETIITNLIK